jgi:hypothetical protein
MEEVLNGYVTNPNPTPTNNAEKRLRMHQIMKIWRAI